MTFFTKQFGLLTLAVKVDSSKKKNHALMMQSLLILVQNSTSRWLRSPNGYTVIPVCCNVPMAQGYVIHCFMIISKTCQKPDSTSRLVARVPSTLQYQGYSPMGTLTFRADVIQSDYQDWGRGVAWVEEIETCQIFLTDSERVQYSHSTPPSILLFPLPPKKILEWLLLSQLSDPVWNPDLLISGRLCH